MTGPSETPEHPRHRTVLLPNGYEVVYQSRAEALYFYHDVFEKRVYLRNGLALRDGDTVFDVGGNIGTTTLFFHSLGRRIESFTFEPAPRLFEILRANAARYAPRAKLFDYGISDREGWADFTFYPGSPGMSTFHPRLEEERDTLRAIMENQLRQGMEGMGGVMRHAGDLLEERFRAETVRCRLRPLSAVIYEQGVERIDLLKVDVQKSELQVLEGIEPADWPKVRQVVMEVHDVDGGVDRATALLDRFGFRVHAEQDEMYAGSRLYNLYALRASAAVNVAPPERPRLHDDAMIGTSSSDDQPERIAVVGMACRFPGAADVQAFWRNLRDGVESISVFGGDELAEVDAALRAHPDFVPAAGTVDGADLFDADFFGLTPREAELTDPQHRLFLEQAWAALEHAGLDPDTFPGPVGVFAGTNLNTYLLGRLRHGARGDEALFNRLRSDKDFLATLASYRLNLRGPSLTVQTACSTSLVAVHLACQSLLDYQCDAALAGGVSVQVPLKGGYIAGSGVLSPDGHCRAFDAAAAGTVGASGVGVVVLKRLSDALADGDQVHAVILASAINNDGARKVGFSAPGVDGQTEVIALAQALANVEPETVTYVEAHGTGTPMGDPVEVAALTRAFGTEARGFCAIGSVKTNIGHADAAAGVASLIKTVLSLEHGQIPPSLHFTRPNPQIDFTSSPFYVADRLQPWTPPAGVPRRAGVSSFGMGGTNAHAVLQEAPVPDALPETEGPRLVVLSARTADALDVASSALADAFSREDAPALADAAFTLARGRRAFAHRRALVAGSAAEAAELLRGADAQLVTTREAAEADPGVAFLFSGLGTQYAGMGRELYETEPAFREAMDRCFAILRERWGMDLAPVLYPAEVPSSAAASGGVDLRALVRGASGPRDDDPLQGARWGHPAMFAVGYALAELWKSRGIEPRAVAGHSLGEYVAACVAGVFSPEDALALVVRRAQLLDGIAGSMAAVSLSEEETRALVDEAKAAGDAVWLAAVNAPRSCVVSGAAEAVERLAAKAREAGAVVMPLAVRHPFHSGLLAPARDEFARLVSSVRRNAPRIPLAANATGKWLRPEQAQSVEYWVEHLLAPVRFAACVDTLRGLGGGAAGEPVLVEVGPGAVLGSWARQQGAARIAVSLRHGQQAGSDRAVFLRALGELWCHGVAIDWSRQPEIEGRRRVVLPGHPLDRRRYWLDADPSAPAETRAAVRRAPEDRLFARLWRQTPDVEGAIETFRGKRVAVFGGAAAAPLAGRLRAAGAEVVRVEAGDEFRDEEAYVSIRPTEPGDFRSLAAALAARGWAGETHTLHLWPLDEAPREVDLDAADDGLAHGVVALLNWMRAGDEAGLLGDGSTLLAATRGAAAVLGTEEIRPWQAAPAAFAAAAASERPGLRCRAADVEARGWEDAVLSEAAALLAGSGDEPAVAYRGRRRWAPYFAATPAPERADGGRVRLRKGGVYLVAGGLGGAGMEIARVLAAGAPGARLLLTGRHPLPPRGDWDVLIASDETDERTRRRISAVRELEAMGAEVRTAAANVADADAVREAVAAAVGAWGTIHGVVHAVPAAFGRALGDESPVTLAAGQAPSVAGALALEAATDGMSLDFFVLAAPLCANGGALGPRAAGAFLDAFAAWRHGRGGTHAAALAWDRAGEGDDDGLSAREAADAFARLLAHGMGPAVAACPGDPAEVARSARTAPRERHAAEPVRGAHPRPAGVAPYVEPRTDLERTLAELFGRALGIEGVGAEDPFFDLGGDSLVATQLLAALNERFGVQLPLRDLFQSSTPARLAVAIVQKQAEQVDDDLLAQALAEL